MLAKVVGEIHNYVVGFLRVEDTPHGSKAVLLGSGTLVRVLDKFAILTADHVLDGLPKKTGRVGLILEKTRQTFTVDARGIEYIRIARGTVAAEGPDLGAIMLSAPIASSIRSIKSFYNLNSRREQTLAGPPDATVGVWAANGFIDEWTMESVPHPGEERIVRFYNFTGYGQPQDRRVVGEHDYYSYPVSGGGRAIAPEYFNGVSGGGLWHVALGAEKDGTFVHRSLLLAGVVFYQVPTTDTECGLTCHGPMSVYRVAFDAISG